ncbi:MAG: hypothetical protein ACR2N3_04750 [Pyrinomonadaceae bacterium]
MTTSEARKDMYDFLEQNSVEMPTIYKGLSKKIKAYGKTSYTETLEDLQEILENCITSGSGKKGFEGQLMAYKAILNWTKNKLK